MQGAKGTYPVSGGLCLEKNFGRLCTDIVICRLKKYYTKINWIESCIIYYLVKLSNIIHYVYL